MAISRQLCMPGKSLPQGKAIKNQIWSLIGVGFFSFTASAELHL